MPLYEYECDACAHRFEVIQKFSDAPVDICPRCGSAVRKLLSSPAIQFKGSGWYVTDYARAGKPDSTKAASGKSDSAAPASSDGVATAKTDTKSDSKSESKPDTKPDSKPSASAKSD